MKFIEIFTQNLLSNHGAMHLLIIKFASSLAEMPRNTKILPKVRMRLIKV